MFRVSIYETIVIPVSSFIVMKETIVIQLSSFLLTKEMHNGQCFDAISIKCWWKLENKKGVKRGRGRVCEGGEGGREGSLVARWEI